MRFQTEEVVGYIILELRKDVWAVHVNFTTIMGI